MYIKKITFKNVKCFDHLEMEFDTYPGWHVILGENGTGKTTLLKAIAISLFSDTAPFLIEEDYTNWVKYNKEKGEIEIVFDSLEKPSVLKFDNNGLERTLGIYQNKRLIEDYYNPNKNDSFHASFGTFRRIGTKNLISNNQILNKAIAHITLFDESYTFVGTVEWLKTQKLKEFEGNEESIKILKYIKHLFNNTDLLPEKVRLNKVSSDGVEFMDSFGNPMSLYDMSTGYQSVLSMLMELVRLMTLHFPIDELFKSNKPIDKNFAFDVKGVVLIDEVDIHLHPTWQVQIGNWFKRYFPNIQFIVTTHSPLICQSAKDGSIWKLGEKGAEKSIEKIEGDDFNRLVYGNILNAMGTELFGKNVMRSEYAKKKLERLAKLNSYKAFGKITKEEEVELKELRKLFETDDQYHF